ncbi:ATP-binding cassette domain-containing protein [Nonomuraea sp. B12E4]|uniref:ATP-binding cassette domain-containing protein n=1 Tax=Nonomuraea sp. B12E4 TaxID=3153564 RepID=UPI00325F7359
MRTAPNSDLVLSCRRIRHSFGTQLVIDDMSFDVHAGQAHGLTGDDQSGKTTAIRIASGLMAADRGSVLLDGRPIDEIHPLRRSIGYVAQNVATVPSLTVAQTVRFWARLARVPQEQREDHVGEVLALTGLQRHADTPVGACPGGVLRQLSLAVALLGRPRLLVLDEPGRGIDPHSRERLLLTLARLRDDGLALIYAGRDRAEVASLCDHVNVLPSRRETLRRETLRRETLRRETLRRETLQRETLQRETLQRETLR